MQPYGLEGAWQRLARAFEHLDELSHFAGEFRGEIRDVGDPLEDLYANDEDKLRLRLVEIPDRIGILGGEVIYNLRAALDYLIFGLSWHDGGRRPTGKTAAALQFPISSDRTKFWANAPRNLSGLTNDNVARVASYQPFAGCSWLSDLAALSNSDKHQHLLWLVGRVSTDQPWEHRWRNAEGDVVPQSDLAAYDRQELFYEDVTHIEVALEDGRQLVPTLGRLAEEVEELLREFKPEFNLEPIQDEHGGWA